MTQQVQGKVVVIGCGFVADLYMRSFETFPNVTVIGAYDVNGNPKSATKFQISTVPEAIRVIQEAKSNVAQRKDALVTV
ncbi:MAG: hypothetical protein VX181_04400, partial [Pseudomonadota bacterium]|nr:hypothetical protein [Pseudomonadota bacterium]